MSDFTDTAMLRASAARASEQQSWDDAYRLWSALAERLPQSSEALHHAWAALPYLKPSGREVIVVYGNCQADFITLLCSHIPLLTRRFRFVAVTNHGYRNRPRPPMPDAVDEAVLVWEQYDQHAAADVRDQMRARIPAGTPVIRFPALTLTALWPFACIDRRPGRSDPARYGFGDRVGLEVAASGLPRERMFDRYMEISLRMMPDVRALLERDRAVLERRDEQCDVTMSAFVFEHLRTTQHFDTWTYANSAVMREMILRLLEFSGSVVGEVTDLLADHLLTACAMCPSQAPSQVPIHPAVIEQLGLTYVDEVSTYHWYGQRWSFREYVTRYIALDSEW